MKRIFSGILVCLILLTILFLTLQGPKETSALSRSVQQWLKSHGIRMESHILRSLAHIPLYILLGITLALFTQTMGWNKPWLPILLGCLIGLADETFKIFRSTREFDAKDLLLDFIGVAIGAGIILLINRKRKTD